jgi:hypothetical protein
MGNLLEHKHIVEEAMILIFMVLKLILKKMAMLKDIVENVNV